LFLDHTAHGPPAVLKLERMRTSSWDAVIFDYGRVLSHPPTAEHLRQFSAITGIPDPKLFFDLYGETREAYDCGCADYRAHWQTFCEASGISLAPNQVDELAAMETHVWMRINPEMLALARELKGRGLRTAILSNMPADLLAELRSGFDWLDEFEVQIWSCEVGTVKPDPAIYRACLDALGCEPSRALFFDDRPRNVAGAQTLGIDAHLFESVRQAKEIVERGFTTP
jgi:putative hydrolase of the HAD superfamily